MGHLVDVSIVGIDRVPVPYFRHKLAAEQLVVQSGLPWSIQRATQFHQFVDDMLKRAARLPVLLLPTSFLMQPIDPDDLARHLCVAITSGPAARLPDLGGPEVLTLRDLARTWLAVRRLRRPILHLPLPGAAARAVQLGALTCPSHREGQINWAAWLAQTYDMPVASHYAD